MPAPRERLLLSCEHGGARVPRGHAARFAGAGAVLRSHRGYDPGALGVARALARALGAPLHAATVSRLVVDLNRSRSNPRLFSEFMGGLGAAEREELLARYYTPHRAGIEARVEGWIARGWSVLHVAVHSFAPVLDGRPRSVDVGLLYDPARSRERRACARWKALLGEIAPELRVRRNHPYRGRDDGLTRALRRQLPDRWYAGVELEVNQAWLRPGSPRRRRMLRALRLSLGRLCAPPGR